VRPLARTYCQCACKPIAVPVPPRPLDYSHKDALPFALFGVITCMSAQAVGMIEPLLQAQLDPVARRVRRLRLWRALGWYWLFAAISGAALLVLGGFLGVSLGFCAGGIAAAAVIGSWVVHQRVGRWRLDYRQIARQIEQQH